MSEFKRENRYLVIKWRDAVSALGDRELEALQGLADAVSEHRKELEKPALECVVVESDWPIYEQAWALIKQMDADWSDTDAHPTPSEQDYRELQSQYDELQSLMFNMQRERDGLSLCFNDIERLVKALSWLGCSTPESKEEQAARQRRLVLDLIHAVEESKDLLMKAVSVSVTDSWKMMCGDWKEDLVSLHGPSGLIASGLSTDQATAIIHAHGGTSDMTTKGGAA